MPANRDAPLLDPVHDVWQNPRLDGTIEAFAEVHQRHCRTGAPAFQSSVDAAVPCRDHDDLLMPVGVTLDEIVGDVGKILPRNAQEIRIVVISRRKYHGLRLIGLAIVPPLHVDPKSARYRLPGQALDVHDVLTRANVEVVVLRYPQVIDQTVAAGG